MIAKRIAEVWARAAAMTAGVVLICFVLKGLMMWREGGGGFWAGWDGGAVGAIWERLPASLALYGVALVLCVGLGIPLGRWWGERRWGWLGGSVSVLVAGVVAVPAFWLAAMSVHYFGNMLEFPVLERVGESGRIPGLWQLLVPAGVVGLTGAGLAAGRIRRRLKDASNDASMEVLKSRGIGYARRVGEYAVPASGMTPGSLAGEMLPVVVGISVAVEWAWYFPGLGSYAGAAIYAGDGPGVLLVALVAGLVTVGLRFIIELLDAIGSRTRGVKA
ncbi:MAG: ABC transporter permease subunit [Verrucomicrobiota bacterium]